jgi:F-type H+-transporting ATPase subunit b
VKRLTVRRTLLLILLFGTAAAWASQAEGHAGIPWKLIAIQSLNLGGLLAFIVWKSKTSIASHFTSRRELYFNLVGRADAAKRDAEKSRSEILNKLRELEDSKSRVTAGVQAEANELRQSIIKEAAEAAARLKSETERSAQLEIEKARLTLRREALEQAIQSSRKSLVEKVGGPEQKKLQTEFVQKIEVVG